MAEPTRAVPVGVDVVHDVVRVAGANAPRHVVEIQRVPHPPGDDVVGARRVTADAQPAQQGAVLRVERESSAKDVDAADALTDHRILLGAEPGCVALIGCLLVHWIALLQAEQAAARLRRREEVAGRQREVGEAESVCGIGFLRRDHPASRPLGRSIGPAESHHPHDARPVHHGGPHVEAQAAVVLRYRGIECRLHLCKRGEPRLRRSGWIVVIVAARRPPEPGMRSSRRVSRRGRSNSAA